MAQNTITQRTTHRELRSAVLRRLEREGGIFPQDKGPETPKQGDVNFGINTIACTDDDDIVWEPLADLVNLYLSGKISQDVLGQKIVRFADLVDDMERKITREAFISQIADLVEHAAD